MTETYLKTFETFEQNGRQKDPSWLKQIRKEAADSFKHLGFPTVRDEAWIYTNLAPLAKTQFQFVQE